MDVTITSKKKTAVFFNHEPGRKGRKTSGLFCWFSALGFRRDGFSDAAFEEKEFPEFPCFVFLKFLFVDNVFYFLKAKRNAKFNNN